MFTGATNMFMEIVNLFVKATEVFNATSMVLKKRRGVFMEATIVSKGTTNVLIETVEVFQETKKVLKKMIFRDTFRSVFIKNVDFSSSPVRLGPTRG